MGEMNEKILLFIIISFGGLTSAIPYTTSVLPKMFELYIVLRCSFKTSSNVTSN